MVQNLAIKDDTQAERLKIDLEKAAAEREKLAAETEAYRLEAKRHEMEVAEIASRLSRPWYHIRLVSLIQAVIAGIVTGVLIWAFVIDNVIKLAQLQTQIQADQQQLEQKNDDLEKDKSALLDKVADLRDQIVRLKSAEASEESNLKQFAATELDSLSSLQMKYSVGSQDTWFTVIASTYNERDLRGRLERLKEQAPEYPIEIYRAHDKSGVPVYAVTLGGYLTKAECIKRTAYAKRAGIASDAYSWSSRRWGENIAAQFGIN